MACTVRFASENARLGQPEVKLGLIPGYGGSQRLPRLVAAGRALELLLAGDPIGAAEAHRIGLVNAIVPQPELLNYSRAWLAKVLANGPVAVALTMEAVDAGLEWGSKTACAWKRPPSDSVRPQTTVAKERARFSKRETGLRGKVKLWETFLKASYRPPVCGLPSW